MTSLLITNNSYTKIPTIKEADFHSNIGKSGENCNYGSNSSWKGEPPSEGFVYPKVTLYSYEDIVDGDIDESDTQINSYSATPINTKNSTETGMFCEKTPLFRSYASENNNSRIYPLGSSLDGYFLDDYYSSVGLQSKSGMIPHFSYRGKNLSQTCPYFYDGMRSWKDVTTESKLVILDTSNLTFEHCAYSEDSPYLFVDKELISLDVKRNSDGTMNTSYYNGIDKARLYYTFVPSEASGHICLSFLVRGRVGSININSYVEPNGLTLSSNSSYISEGTVDGDSIVCPDKWERVYTIVGYSGATADSSIRIGFEIPIYWGDKTNLSRGISFCEGMVSETSYPLVWNQRFREASLPTSKSPIIFDLLSEYRRYDVLKYLSTLDSWTISYRRKIGVGTSSIVDTIGRMTITTTFTPSGGKIQIDSIENGTKGNNNIYTLDYSASPLETIYLTYNRSTSQLHYYLFVEDTLITDFTQSLSTFGNCLNFSFLDETDGNGIVITKDRYGNVIDPYRIGVILGGYFTVIDSDRVKDLDIDISPCEVAYSDFVFLENKGLSEDEITKIQKTFMVVSDSSEGYSPERIIYEYSIFEESPVEGSTSKLMEYRGTLKNEAPSNTVVIFANNFTEK